MNKSLQSILVTGGSGYIGTVLVPHLLEAGYHVRVIDRLLFGDDLLSSHPHLQIIKEDVRQLSPEHFSGIDAVIDMVSISNDPSGEKFQQSTMEINWQARARCAKLAREAGVKRYILTSSCSLYGFQEDGVIASEQSPTNPLTTYAKANERAEQENLPLNSPDFTVIVLRLATVFGLSPRMRFDLAINGMTYGAYTDHKLPLLRDGSQWRPLVHIKDVAMAHKWALEAEEKAVGGQIFNVGSKATTYQIEPLGQLVAAAVSAQIGQKIPIEWYGDPDHRSYRVDFSKIEALGFKTSFPAAYGVQEIVAALQSKNLSKTPQSITLGWYEHLSKLGIAI